MAASNIGKRKAERRNCRVRAQAQFGDGRSPVDCVVLNFSATGARIQLNDPVELPKRFKLFIPSRPETKNVLLRWTSEKEFGVEFSGGMEKAEDVLYDLIDRVEAIETRIKGSGASIGAIAGENTDGAAPAGFDIKSLIEPLAQRLDALDVRFEAGVGDIEAKLALLANMPIIPPFDPEPLQREVARTFAKTQQTAQDIAQVTAQVIVEEAAQKSVSALERKIADGVEKALAASRDATALAERLDRVITFKFNALDNQLANIASAKKAQEPSEGEGEHNAFYGALAEFDRALRGKIDLLESEIAQIAQPARAKTPEPEYSEYNVNIVRIAARISALEARLETALTFAGAGAISREIAPQEDYVSRISNLELALLELRMGGAHEAKGGLKDALEQRVRLIEDRNGDVMSALRDILSLLTPRAEQRATG